MENSKLLPRYPAVYPVTGNRSPEAEYGCQYLASVLHDIFENDRLTRHKTLNYPYLECISEMADAGYTCIWIGGSYALAAAEHLSDLLIVQVPLGLMVFCPMDVDSADSFLTYVQVNQQFYDYNSYLFLPDFPLLLARDLAYLYPLSFKQYSRGMLFQSTILSEKQLYYAVLTHSMIYPLEGLDSNEVKRTLKQVEDALSGQYKVSYMGLELLVEEASYLEGEEILKLFNRTLSMPVLTANLSKEVVLPIGDRLLTRQEDDRTVYYFVSDQGGVFQVNEEEGVDPQVVHQRFVEGRYFSPWARKIAHRFAGYLVSSETVLHAF